MDTLVPLKIGRITKERMIRLPSSTNFQVLFLLVAGRVTHMSFTIGNLPLVELMGCSFFVCLWLGFMRGFADVSFLPRDPITF